MRINSIVTDRREFLSTGLLGTAVLAATSAGLRTGRKCAAAAADDPFGGFKVGIQSFCYHRFDALTAIREISGLGLQHVELYPGHSPIDASDGEFKILQSMLSDHGLSTTTIGVLGFSSDHDANRINFEHAARLGASAIGADPSPDSFDSLDRLVQEYKIPIAIHPHGPIDDSRLHLWHRAESFSILSAILMSWSEPA